MKKEKVILVDKKNRKIGEEEKLKAHQYGGKLHRAFSIIIFNSNKEILIQKRAKNKYHCPGLWANTCCSHPRPGEKTQQAAKRRLMEEMGFTCKIKKKFDFIYKVNFDNGLSENEFDNVYVGIFDGVPSPNPIEVEKYKWISLSKLRKEIKNYPKKYACWFKIIMKKAEFYKLF